MSVTLVIQHVQRLDWGSVVGITTRYTLDGTGIESRCRARFSAPVQTGPLAHPCTMGTRSPSRGQSGLSVALTTHSHLVPWLKKEYTHTSTHLCAFMAYSRVRAVICGLSGSTTFLHIMSQTACFSETNYWIKNVFWFYMQLFSKTISF